MADTLGRRLAESRKELKLTQDMFCTQTGIPKSSLQKYEGGHSVPGTDALSMIAKAGVNVHWLITGVGEMLTSTTQAPALQPKAAPFRINVDALVAAYDGAKRTAKPGQTDEQTLRHAVSLYMFMLEKGMITEDGIGRVDLGNVA